MTSTETQSSRTSRWQPEWLQPEMGAILVVAAVLFASAGEVFFWGREQRAVTEMDALGITVLAVSGVILFWRRRYAFQVLVGVGALALTFMALDYPPDAMLPAVVVALYSVGAEGDRGTTLLIAILVAVTIGMLYLSGEGFRPGSGMVLEIFRFLLPLALGDAVRSRRAYESELIHRAEEAERTREEEAMRRVQEERIRIARDIHDLVSHSISTVNVQAGVAAHLVEKDPSQASQALETIRDSTREVLTELRSMLGVLRSPDDAAPLTPLSAADETFTALFENMRSAGMDLEVSVEGEPPQEPVTEAARIATYRIIQESLTNALRHGTADPVAIDAIWGRNSVIVRISNTMASDSADEGTGSGLLGMRERATTLGGTLTAAPTPDGRWVVAAELPYRTAELPRRSS